MGVHLFIKINLTLKCLTHVLLDKKFLGVARVIKSSCKLCVLGLGGGLIFIGLTADFYLVFYPLGMGVNVLQRHAFCR